MAVATPSFRQHTKRRAATTVEMAIALTVLITLTLGAVDLGYGVFRQHVLTHSARQLARQAIVRGKLADRLESWGPDPVSITADASHPVSEYLAPQLVGCDLHRVKIQLTWPEGGHDPQRGHHVEVALEAPYQPLLTYLLPWSEMRLTATSTMALAH